MKKAIAPAKQLRLARFLQNLEARTLAAGKIIDHYVFQVEYWTQSLTPVQLEAKFKSYQKR